MTNMLISAKTLYKQDAKAEHSSTSNSSKFTLSESQGYTFDTDADSTFSKSQSHEANRANSSGKRPFDELCPTVRQHCSLNWKNYSTNKEFFVPPSITMKFPLDDPMFKNDVKIVDVSLSGERDRLFALLCSQYLDQKLLQEAVAIPLCGVDEKNMSHMILCVICENSTLIDRVEKLIEEFKRISNHPHVLVTLENGSTRSAFVDVEEHLRRAVICQLLVRGLQQDGWYLQTGRTHIRPTPKYKKEEKIDEGTLRYATPILLMPDHGSTSETELRTINCLRLASLGGSSVASMTMEISYWAERWLWQDSIIADRYEEL